MARYSRERRREMFETHRRFGDFLAGVYGTHPRDMKGIDLIKKELAYLSKKDPEGFVYAIENLSGSEKKAVLDRYGLRGKYEGRGRELPQKEGDFNLALRRLGGSFEKGHRLVKILSKNLPRRVSSS